MADLLSHHPQESDKRFRIRAGGSLVTFFFYLSLGVFLVALAAYGGLVLLNRAQAGVEEELRVQIKEKEEESRSQALGRIFLLDSQLSNLRNILSNHVFATNALAFVEQTVHPQVQFENFGFAGTSLKVDMQGNAASYAVVTQQIALFQLSPLVQSVGFGGLALGEAGVTFNVSLIFTPDLLRFNQ
jgi:hypothetical protein